MKRYLRSIGVNPVGVVIQRGHLNYAGPHCPGKAWTCTRARKVVQIATRTSALRRTLAGTSAASTGENRVECNPGTISDPGSQFPGQFPTSRVDCEITQVAQAADNVAICTEVTTDPGTSGICSIGQFNSNGRNRATVLQQARQSGVPAQQPLAGFDQVALQVTGVRQFNERGGNEASVTEGIDQRIDSGSQAESPTRVEGAGQSIDFYQQGNGTNRSDINQTFGQNVHNLAEKVDDIELGIQGITVFQCGTSAGLCVDGSGELTVNVHQSYSQSLQAPQANLGRQAQEAAPFSGTCTIDQTGTTGVCGTVNQLSAGVSRASVKQRGLQLASAPKSSQVAERQDDPFSCCTGDPLAQLVNPNNRFELDQDRTQLASSDIYLQLADSMEGSCLTSGACAVRQRANQNGAVTLNSCTGSGCDIFITCAAGGPCTATSAAPPATLARRRT